MRIPHLVYGSFPWSDLGHHLAGISPDVRPSDRKAVVRYCDQWGEIGTDDWRPSLNLFPLPSDDEDEEPNWALIRMIPLGADYAGRSGAVLRHAMILDPSTAFLCRLNPFCVNDRGYFLDEWGPDDRCESLEVPDAVCFSEYQTAFPESWRESLARDLEALLGGQRLLAWLPEPTEDSDLYIRTLFSLTPQPLRGAVEVATFRVQSSRTADLAVIRGPGSTDSGDVAGRPPFKTLDVKEDIRPELPDDLCDELVTAVRRDDSEAIRALLLWESYVA